jgi:hypothetical protein
VELTADATAPAAFAPLLTLTIATTQFFLDIWASLSLQIAANASANFRITVDGVPASNGGVGIFPGNSALIESVAFVKRVAVAPGNHTVVLEWRSSGLAEILVASDPDDFHASLRVEETN